MQCFEYPRIGETVYRETLDNGFSISILPKKGFTRMYAMLGIHYGSLDRRYIKDGILHETPAGIAHYLEHKAFDTEFEDDLTRMAQKGSEPNAFTGEETTCYYFDCVEHFEENLTDFLNMVLSPKFSDETVEKERGIIAQEIRMTLDDPEWQLYRDLLTCLYGEHAIAVPVAGDEESILKIDTKLLQNCYDTFYSSSNMHLSVVGNVDAERIIMLVKDLVQVKTPVHFERVFDETNTLPVSSFHEANTEISMPSFSIGFKCAPSKSPRDRLRLSILGDVACDILMGDSSPLYNRLYASGMINGSFNSGFTVYPGIAFADAGGDTQNPYAVKEEILTEVQRICAQGIDDETYYRTQKAMFGITLKDLDSFENLAVSEIEGRFFQYDTFTYPEIYESITKQDILQFIRENFTEEHCAMAVLWPKEENNEYHV